MWGCHGLFSTSLPGRVLWGAEKALTLFMPCSQQWLTHPKIIDTLSSPNSERDPTVTSMKKINGPVKTSTRGHKTQISKILNFIPLLMRQLVKFVQFFFNLDVKAGKLSVYFRGF